jgi:hypothetical protein
MVRTLTLLAGVALLVVGVDPALAKSKKRSGKKGTVTVECSIAGARVLLNGKGVGKTPLRDHPLPAGSHTVTVKKPGFLDYSEKIQGGPGKAVKVFADLLPFAGVLKVTASVANAEVAVDGKVVGKAPLEHEVKIGSHEVRVTTPGQAPFVTTVQADPGNEYPVHAAFSGAPAPAVDELALVPVGSGGDDPLALTSPPSGGADDLTLAPLPGSGSGSGSSASGAPDDLALAALTPLPGAGGGLEEIAAVDPALVAPTRGEAVGTTVTPAKPWYLTWWALSAAAAIVITGVTVTAIAVSGGGDPEGDRVDGVWTIGAESEWYDSPTYAVWAF